MCGCGAIDQTPKEVFEHLKGKLKENATKDELYGIQGTGLFLLPDPKTGVLDYQTVIVPNLGIDECRKRGTNCVAYKWIPATLISLPEIESHFNNSGRPGSCFEFCNFAGGGCPSLCWCPPDSNFCR